MKVGDLVRYVEKPAAAVPKIVPKGERPIGVVISVEEKLLEYNSEPDAIMVVVKVKWSDDKWNGQDGLSEECCTDLELIQTL